MLTSALHGGSYCLSFVRQKRRLTSRRGPVVKSVVARNLMQWVC